MPSREAPPTESVWDYPRPPALRRDTRQIVVACGGEIIADTTNALMTLETNHPPVFYESPNDCEPSPATHGASGKAAPTTGTSWSDQASVPLPPGATRNPGRPMRNLSTTSPSMRGESTAALLTGKRCRRRWATSTEAGSHLRSGGRSREAPTLLISPSPSPAPRAQAVTAVRPRSPVRDRGCWATRLSGRYRVPGREPEASAPRWCRAARRRPR